MQQYIFTYLVSVCKPAQCTVVTTTCLAVTLLCIFPFVYEYEGGPFTLGRVGTIVQMTFLVFVIHAVFGLIITYIVRIRGKMGYLVIENVQLLNKMNEGLIVVDDEDKSLKFASMPAVRLLKQLPHRQNFDQDETVRV